MKRKFKRGISYILCVMIALSMMVISPIAHAEGIENPVYDSDTKTSVYSYVYFGHYPQSEIMGDDLTDDIINANYNKYGVAIANRQQIFKKDGKYYLVEPIKWKVLNIDNNYMLLQTDNIIAHGIDYRGYADNSWKISDLRSWLNGYSADKNSNSNDYTTPFENFCSVAFSEDEYDTCQLRDITRGDITTSDYITIPDLAMVTNNDYGFYEDNDIDIGTVTRQKTETDYARACALKSDYSYYTDYWYLIGGNDCEQYVRDDGNLNDPHYYFYHDYHYICGIAPIVKILVNSDQYYTSKPELEMGEDISTASVKLKYDSINYSGEARTPTVTVKAGDKTLVENANYTVQYSDNINGGTAKVTITGCGDYYGSIEKTFTITRKDQTISRVEPSYTVTDGEAFRLNAITSGDGAITYSSSDESVAIAAKNTGKITTKGVGTATITITAAQTDNYNQTTEKVKITVLPKKLTGLKDKSVTTSSINLSWNKVKDASGYEVYRYSPTQEEYKKIKTITSGSTTSFKNTKLSAGKTYKYMVRAYTKIGSKKYYGEFSSAKTTTTKPKKTKITKMTSYLNVRGSSWITVKYKKVACTAYEIKFADNKKFRYAHSVFSNNNSGGLVINGSRYWYAKVRPYKEFNGKTYYGSWSKVKRVKV